MSKTKLSLWNTVSRVVNIAAQSTKSLGSAHLTSMLDAAIPLWIHKFADLTFDERQEQLQIITTDDFCFRLEYVLHRGPKEGDSARAFNDLARAIALLAFCPGGVKAFGRHWEHKKKRNKL